MFTNPGQASGVPAYDGDYHTIEIALNRRFSGRWLLLTSFEQTWADDFRAVATGTSSLDVVRQGTLFLWRPNQRRLGRQRSTFWNYKLVGRYILPWDVGVSASYKFQNGYQWARQVSVSLPNAGTEAVLAEPIEANRADNVHILDFRFEKSLKIPGIRKLTGMVDVFNALNANPVTNFRTITGPRFKEVIAVLDPRIVRFGVRWDF